MLDNANSEISKYIKKTTGVYTKARYKEIAKKLKEISSALKDNVENGTDIDGVIEYELKKQSKLLNIIKNDIIKIKDVGEVNFIYPSVEQIRTSALFKPVTTGSYAMTYQSYLDGIENGLYNTWDSAVRTGYLTGQTTKQIVKNVLGGVTQTEKLTNQGSITSLRNSIYANTRTVLQSMANETMSRVYEANEEYFAKNDRYEYLATLDSRTCLVCGALDGKTFNNLNDEKYQIPKHRGCRCVVLPHFEIEGDTRASKDGQVDAKLSFNGWLNEQDEKTQLDVLGRTRFELFRREEPIAQFVDNGKTLTLKELSEKDDLIAEAINEIRHKEKGYITNYKNKSYEEKLQSVQDWLIRKQNKSGVERGVLLDKNGNILAIEKGTVDSVTFNTNAEWFINAKEKSIDMIHNHPKNSTLSLNDLSAFWQYKQIRSVSAVTKIGHRYTMTAMKNVSFDNFVNAWIRVSKEKDINKRYEKLALILCWKYTIV